MTTDKTKNFFRVSAEDFKKIPGCPIAYWMKQGILSLFQNAQPLNTVSPVKKGIDTGENALFLREWHEVSMQKLSYLSGQNKWFFYIKGGEYRKWYGNIELIVNWENDGQRIREHKSSTIRNQSFFRKEAITWSLTGTKGFAARYIPPNCMFDNNGSSVFPTHEQVNFLISYLNTEIVVKTLSFLNPTIAFQVGDIANIPIFPLENCNFIGMQCISISRTDWDSYETSWDFQTNPLLTAGNRLNSGGNQFDLSAIYIALRRDWQRQTEEMRRLEIENNRIFIDAYGLQDELSPEVPWNEITLTCNPWYRYGKSPEAISVNSEQWTVDSGEMPKDSLLEARLLEDTIKEFISYAVGCMMGRYSPEKPGLILANQGEDIDRYKEILIDKNTCIDQAIAEKVLYSESTTILTAPFYPVHECCGHRIHEIADRDGVIPILDEEWFVDDIVAQFKQFLRFTFGEEHFADNLDFIEKALGKDLRKYFIKDFYKDHVQRYKKRPIYWMFSSPKGSFNALIYMHRYRPDTVSIVLNEYLREFISKIRAKREHLIGDNNRTPLSPAEKTRNLKQIDKYAAMLTELDAYERDILYPLAQEKIAIDLDDGVKVNYVKFGAALKKIPGLEAKEE